MRLHRKRTVGAAKQLEDKVQWLGTAGKLNGQRVTAPDGYIVAPTRSGE